jgi:hypothetical protein
MAPTAAWADVEANCFSLKTVMADPESSIPALKHTSGEVNEP